VTHFTSKHFKTIDFIEEDVAVFDSQCHKPIDCPDELKTISSSKSDTKAGALKGNKDTVFSSINSKSFYITKLYKT